MRCFPSCFSFKNIFSPKRSPTENTQSTTPLNFDVPHSQHAFHDGVYKILDGIDPPLKTSRSTMDKLANVMKNKLKMQGKKLDIGTQASGTTNAYATGFRGIFKQCSSKRFALRLSNHQIVERSRAEVELHIMLQSHLKARYGDRSIRDSEVLKPRDLEQRAHGSRFKLFARRNSAVESDETKSLLSHQSDLAAQDSCSDTSSIAKASCAEEESTVLQKSDPYISLQPVPKHPRSRQSFSAVSVPDVHVVPPDVAVESGPDTQAPVMVVPADHGNVARTLAQEKMVTFIEQRLGWSLLPFFEAVAQESTELAAYLFVQAERMRTMTDPDAGGDPGYGRSAFPGVLVSKMENGTNLNGAAVRYEDRKKKASITELMIETGSPHLLPILLQTLKAEIEHQNQATRSDGLCNFAGKENDQSGIFPRGLMTAMTRGMQPSHSTGGPCTKYLLFPERCAADPARAVFMGFASEMLCVSHSSVQNQAERYRYPKELSALAQEVSAQHADTGNSCVDTFMPGVEQDFYAAYDSQMPWRIKGETEFITKAEVLNRVFDAACAHLHADRINPASIGPLPLCAYELLARSLGTNVPQYLKDHEADVLRELANRRQEVIDQHQSCIAAAQRAKEEEERSNNASALRNAQSGAANTFEFSVIRNHFQADKVMKAAVDRTFTVSLARGNQLDAIRSIQEDLKKSHCRQTICYKTPDGLRDNRCWMRASWMALFMSMPPAKLARLAAEMLNGSAGEFVKKIPNILEALAQQFHEDPGQFLYGSPTGSKWRGSLLRPARLGNFLLSDTKGVSTSSSEKTNNSTTENWLFSIQTSIATEFRTEMPSVLREVSAVANFRSMASSDLPIMLHRAFNTPAMMVEAGVPTIDANGASSTMSAQVRIVAPAGSVLAQKISAAAERSMTLQVDGAVLKELLDEFTDLPVFWLEEEHYDLYVPSTLIQAQDAKTR